MHLYQQWLIVLVLARFEYFVRPSYSCCGTKLSFHVDIVLLILKNSRGIRDGEEQVFIS
jgi:hypothetical protein